MALGAVTAVLAFFEITPKNGLLLLARIFRNRPPPALQPPEPNSTRIGLVPGRVIIGREDKVASLGDALQTGGRVVLAGQGGVGKSSLARHYAETQGAQYHGIVWTRAGTQAEVISGLMAVGGALGMTRPDVPQLADGQAVLAKVAGTGRRWLFIYDNVESFADIKALIPQGAPLIVTTRGGEGWQGFAVQRPGLLAFDTESSPAVRLLQAEADRKGDAVAARGLAEALGGLPLALVVAGALIRATGEGYAVYAGRLAQVLAHVPANEDYPTSVIGAVTLSYEALSADAKIVADLCAWWAAEGLHPDLLTEAPSGEWWGEWLNDVPEAVQALAADSARVRVGFVELTGRSLLVREGEAWAMHRMTALALRLMQGAGSEVAVAAAALLDAVYPRRGGVQASGNWPLCSRLTPHVLAIWDTGAAPQTGAMDTLLCQSGIYLSKIADYPGAAKMSGARLAGAEARLPKADREFAIAIGNHGLSLARLGDLPGAVALLERALELDAEHRPASAELSNKHNTLGWVLLCQGRAGQLGALVLAARQYQQALALRRRLFGRGEQVAQTLNGLGSVRKAQARMAAAARLQRVSLAIRRKVLPLRDVRLGYGLVNTGSGWLKAGRSDLAEPLLREALDLRQDVYARQPQHPEPRNAAKWLILCLLRRAAVGENRGLREMEARQLCDRYGFEFEERKVRALLYPYEPVVG